MSPFPSVINTYDDVPPVSVYELRPDPPSVETFQRLRARTDVPPRPESGVQDGLGNEVFVVTVVETETEQAVGMARVLGDGGTVCHITDMAVDPDHQRQGLGSRMMDRIDEFLAESAPDGAYVNLMDDVDGFYEQWGFEETRPASKGMYKRVGEE